MSVRDRLEAMGIDLPADIKKKRPEELPMDLEMLRELLYSESAQGVYFMKANPREPLRPAQRKKLRAKDKVARKSRQINQRKRAVKRRRVEKRRKQRAA